MAKSNGAEALIAAKDSVLVLVDHQAFQFANLNSHEPTMVLNNTIALAKAAKVFDVPCILTTVTEQRGGKLVPGVQAVYPDQVPIDRTTLDAWADQRVVDAVRKTGRKRVIVAALWTEICLALTVIHALEEFDVTIITDASGGVSREAHDMAVLRMIQKGANPMTWMAILGEWQRDWANEATVPGQIPILVEHGGASGIAFLWEQQLLQTAAAAS